MFLPVAFWLRVYIVESALQTRIYQLLFAPNETRRSLLDLEEGSFAPNKTL
jgi:hypothetical protein